MTENTQLSDRFSMERAFLDEKDLGPHILKGEIYGFNRSYIYNGEDDKRQTLKKDYIKSYQDWNTRITRYLDNPPKDSSPALLQFIAERRFDISMMLIAFADLHFGIDISDSKPFVCFEEKTLHDVEDFFNDYYMAGAPKKWDEENERHGLWETLRRTLDQVLHLSQCKIYFYVPKNAADDPHVIEEDGVVLDTLYCFFVNSSADINSGVILDLAFVRKALKHPNCWAGGSGSDQG